MDKYLQLLGRVFLAHIFILAGKSKITGYAATQGYMDSVGVAGMLLPLVIILELGGVWQFSWAGKQKLQHWHLRPLRY